MLSKSKKLGTLEVEMASNFNPKILEVELQQNQLECRNAIDMIAITDPTKLQEFLQEYDRQEKIAEPPKDNRVAHSLITNQRADQEFD